MFFPTSIFYNNRGYLLSFLLYAHLLSHDFKYSYNNLSNPHFIDKKIFSLFKIVVQLQLSPFPTPTNPHHPTHPHLPPSILPLLWLSPCVLYTCALMILPHFPCYPLPTLLWVLSVCSLFQCSDYILLACLSQLLEPAHILGLMAPSLHLQTSKACLCPFFCSYISLSAASNNFPCLRIHTIRPGPYEQYRTFLKFFNLNDICQVHSAMSGNTFLVWGL